MSASPRRTVFIKKGFQGRFIAVMVAAVLLSGVVSALLLRLLIGSDLQAQSQSVHVSIDTLWTRIGTIILLGNAVAVCVGGGLAAWLVLHASHRIAGPLYRFEALCAQIAEGRLEGSPALREADQLVELSSAFARMLDALRAGRARRLELAEALEAMAARSEPAQGGAAPSAPELRALAARLRELDAAP